MIESDLEYYSSEDEIINDSELSSTEEDDEQLPYHTARACRCDTLTLSVPVKLDVYRTEITFFVDSLARDSTRTKEFVSTYLDAAPHQYTIWILRDHVLDFPRALAVYHFDKGVDTADKQKQKVVIDEWLCDSSCEFEKQAKDRFDKASKFY